MENRAKIVAYESQRGPFTLSVIARVCDKVEFRKRNRVKGQCRVAGASADEEIPPAEPRRKNLSTVNRARTTWSDFTSAKDFIRRSQNQR